MKDIIKAIRALIPLDVGSMRWHRKRPGTGFIAAPRMLTDDDLAAHVRGDFAVATRHPAETAEYLIFDIDAKNGRTIADRDDVYRKLTGALPGNHFVIQSPGEGLHVFCRVETTSLLELPKIAEGACEVIGLPPSQGVLEIFPRDNACFRVPFGRGSVVLDAETLDPVPGADLRTGDLDAVRDAIGLFEAWLSEPAGGFVDRLRELAASRQSSGRAAPRNPRLPRRTEAPVVVPVPFPTSATSRFHGLTRPHSRYAEEWRIGVMMWRFPAMFAYLGVPGTPTRVDIARGLVTWLERGAQGFSKEWNASLWKGLPTARSTWIDRYLRAGSDGLAPVDRMLHAALALRANVTDKEMREISAMAHTAHGSGIERYRFEVWWTALLLHIKQFVVGREGEIHLCASVLRALPYGRQYRRYLEILESRGRLTLTREYLAQWDNERAPRARAYRVRNLDDGDAHALDLRSLEARVRGHAHHGRAITVAEVVHAVRVSRLFRDVPRRYGASGSRHVRLLAALAQRRSCLEGV